MPGSGMVSGAIGVCVARTVPCTRPTPSFSGQGLGQQWRRLKFCECSRHHVVVCDLLRPRLVKGRFELPPLTCCAPVGEVKQKWTSRSPATFRSLAKARKSCTHQTRTLRLQNFNSVFFEASHVHHHSCFPAILAA